ncbi:MAG: cobalt-precorrin-5B (C(1))-methyltransferase CbiD [Clostridiales bacterium]|jgi:cobalt-precorrin-5B (C1)-methyltransferase|nr:cobalt-precorrin-5B (C(1))-methyltransferase CbiD [Clostridiales bacterium]
MGRKFYNQKPLRRGYTTGACAAAAAKAAAAMLLTQTASPNMAFRMPDGTSLGLDILDASFDARQARCAIKKDSGDDPDITNGVCIYAAARKTPEGITIEGGEGVGHVTKPGLDQPVGAAAINSAPRRMIAAAVREACEEAGYFGGMAVTISVPGGEALAARTFNPTLGIVGGISILGTTGILEPMSERALVDTIRAQISVLRAQGHTRLLITPGNYGEAFARDSLGITMNAHVKCGNFIGDTIALAAEAGFQELLLVGHIGKLVKLGIGVMQTHSSHGDGRMETLIASALEAGARTPLLRELMACVTTDAALLLLQSAGLLAAAMEILRKRVEYHLARRVSPDVSMGFIVFSNMPELGGVLIKSGSGDALLARWEKPA